MTLTLLTYNILRGGVGRVRTLAEVITRQHPDLVVLQEATRPDIVRALAEETGLTTAISHRGRSVGVLSRMPLVEHRYVRPRWSQHAFLEVVPEGYDVRIVGLHLSAVHAAWTERRRVRELRSLLQTVTGRDAALHVLAGDFNTLAPGERLDAARLPLRLRLLVWLSGGRIRWQTIAIMLGAEYADAYRERHETAPGFTFPTWDPHVRLDYVFLPQSQTHRVLACDVITEGPVEAASDHLPLRTVLQV